MKRIDSTEIREREKYLISVILYSYNSLISHVKIGLLRYLPGVNFLRLTDNKDVIQHL